MSQPEIDLGDAEKGDFEERVCGSVGAGSQADQLLAIAELLASLSPEQIKALRRLRGPAD